MKASIRATVRSFKRRIAFYKVVYGHPRTPRVARWLLWAAVAYALSPIDLIPDFIPVVGHLDDTLIILLFVVLAMRMVPEDVIRECEHYAQGHLSKLSRVR